MVADEPMAGQILMVDSVARQPAGRFSTLMTKIKNEKVHAVTFCCVVVQT